nr:hypothetical protein [Tanacetum cinerariifolium]
MEECHRMLMDQVNSINPEGRRIMPDIRKLLPLGGLPGQVTIQSQYFFNKDLEYLVSELVMSLWIKSGREYDISAAYGISQWWFKRKKLYITRHDAPSDHSKFRSHMRILSAISLKTYVRYGHAFLKEIVLRRADYKEYKIAEADFKSLHLNDFEDLYLLHLQEKMDHMVKDFMLFKYNPGTTTRIWSENYKRRSNEFMEVIEHRLKLQRIFRSLKSFIAGRLRDVDYRLIQRTE